MPLDVTKDEEISAAFDQLKREWGNLDVLVHAVAYAPREAISGSYIDNTSREFFRMAHDISSYSLTALTRAAMPLMAGRAGAVVTLSYLGAVRSIPNYNVMGVAKASLEASVRFLAADAGPRGVRVNGISAGPIKTLSAAGIAGFRKILSATWRRSRRCVATSRWKMWATPQRSCARISRPASRARSFTWTVGSATLG